MCGGSGSSKDTTTQQSGPPAWLQGQLQNIGNQAGQLAQQPLQQYSGPLVAGFTPDQQQAFNTVNNAQGMAQPYINSGANYLANSTGNAWESNLPQLGQAQTTALGQQGAGLVGQAANTNVAAAGQPGATMAAQSATQGQNTAAQAGQQAQTIAGQAGQAGQAAAGMGAAAGMAGGQAAQQAAGMGAAAGLVGGQQAQGAAGMGAAAGLAGARSGIGAANAAANQNYDVSQYMSPYTQNVVNATQAQFNNQNEQQRQGVIGNAISAGAFGGDRAEIAQAELANQQQLAQAPVIANLYNQGYGNAQSEFNTEQALRANTGIQTGQLGLSAGLGAGQLGMQGAQTAGQLGLGAGQLGLVGGQTAGQLGLGAGQLGLSGAQTAGQLGLQGAQTAGNLGIAGGQLGSQTGQGLAGLGQSAATAQGQLGLAGGQSLMNEFNQQQAAQLQAQENNNAMQAQAGFGMANLGQEAQQSALTGAQSQLMTGGLQQQEAQQQLNIPYEQFMQQQAYPYQQMNWLTGIESGLAGSAGGTAQTTTPGPSTGSQILGGLGTAASLFGLFSDKRVKEGLTPVGKLTDGQKVYRFRYKGDPTERLGLVAQEVEKRHPEAVGSVGGVKTVDYGAATRDSVKRASGGAVDSSIPDVNVNFMGQTGQFTRGNAPQPSQPQQAMDPTASDIGALSSLAGMSGKLKGLFGSSPDLNLPTGVSTHNFGVEGSPFYVPDFSKGGQVRRADGGAAQFISGDKAPQVSSALFARPTGWDAGGGSPGWFQPMAQYKPEGTKTQTATTNKLPDMPSWANSNAPITRDQLNQLYQTQLGRSPDESGLGFWSGQKVSDVRNGILNSPEYQDLLKAGKVPGETQSTTITGYDYPHTTYTPPGLTGTAQPTVNGIDLAQITGNLPRKRGGVIPFHVKRRDDGGTINDDDAPDSAGLVPRISMDGPVPMNDNNVPQEPMKATGTTGIAPQQPQDIGQQASGIVSQYLNQPAPKAYEPLDTTALKQGVEHPHVDPWMSLLNASLGIMGGTSPHAMVNIGRGAQQGVAEYEREKQQAIAGAEKEFDAAERAKQLADIGERYRAEQATNKEKAAEGVITQQQQAKHQTAEEEYQKGELGLGAQRNAIAQQQADAGRYTYLGPSTDPKNPGSVFMDAKTNDVVVKPVGVGPKDSMGMGMAPSDPNLHGDDYLKTIPNPAIASEVKALIEGRLAPPSGFALKSPYWQNMLTMAYQADPGYNADRYSAGQYFDTKKGGDLIRSQSVSIAHLNTLSQLYDALDNGDMKLFNSVKNRFQEQFSAPAPTNLDAMRNIVAPEIVKAVVGASGGTADREEVKKTVDRDIGQQGAKGVIQTYKQALAGQLGGIRQQYITTTGRKDADFRARLTPEAQSALYPDMPPIPDAAKTRLLANPTELEKFDQIFGPGAGEGVLKSQQP